MRERIGKCAADSKIAKFCINFNQRYLIFFYNSAIYKLFRYATMFRREFLTNAQESSILKAMRRIASGIGLKDIAVFVVLVVICNTLFMLVLEREIDMFSLSARVLAFTISILYILRPNAR